MDIRQLRYFYTIAQQGQITRAAKLLNMAQPPLSQQLKLLEQELDVELFRRNGRKIELTEAGKILYKKAESILHKVDETLLEVREASAGLRGTLAIGTIKSCLSFLPERIAYFTEHFPQVSFRLLEGDPYVLGRYLQNHDIEVALIRLSPFENFSSYHMIRLGTEPLVLVIPKRWDQNPAKTSVEMKDIADYSLLLRHRTNGSGAYEMFLSECQRFGFTPKIICEAPDATVLLSLVAAGIGAAILPKSAVHIQDSNIKVLSITDCTLQSEPAIIWLKDRYLSSMAQRFLELFESKYLVRQPFS